MNNITNYQWENDILSTAGQPSEAEFGLIAENGFSIVINLRPESELVELFFNEGKVIRNLGMEYHQIPMTFDDPNRELLEKFIEVMKQAEGKKVFLHCRMNIRVQALLAIYRIVELGWEKEKALEGFREMVEIPPVWEAFINEEIEHFANL